MAGVFRQRAGKPREDRRDGVLARPAARRSAAIAAAPKGSKMDMPREKQTATQEQPLVRFGLGLANWSERWFPEPLIFALLGIVVVFGVGLLLHQSPAKLAIQGGKNFWTLVPFTMQMVMIIIGGYVVATTPVVNKLIQLLAKIPKTGKGAIAMIALFSMLTSLISWGLSLIFSGLLTREMAKRSEEHTSELQSRQYLVCRLL